MPEFSFYSVKSEWIPLITTLMREHGLRAVPDYWYRHPDDMRQLDCATLTEDQIEAGKMRVFLIGEYTEYPLVFRRQMSGERRGEFAINPIVGGPSIEFHFPPCYVEDNEVRLVPGVIVLHREYHTPDGTGSSPPNFAAQAAFRGIRATLKKHMIAVEVLRREWMTDAVLRAVRSGNARILIRGKWLGAAEIDSRL